VLDFENQSEYVLIDEIKIKTRFTLLLDLLFLYVRVFDHVECEYEHSYSYSYDDVHHNPLTLCVDGSDDTSDYTELPSNSSSSSSDDPISASKIKESDDSALKIDTELSHVPGDINDLASQSKALNNSSSDESGDDDDDSIVMIDTSLINFITNIYDEARICVNKYDVLSAEFSKFYDISPSFDHLTNKSKALFLQTVSTSISFS